MHNNYIFFQSKPALWSIPPKTLQTYKKEFLRIIKNTKEVTAEGYLTQGLKANATGMLWFKSVSLEAIQDLVGQLRKTYFGQYLTITYTLFGLVRKSVYVAKPTQREQAIGAKSRRRYLIIYPFTKTKEWHLLPYDERKSLMMEHIRVGHKYRHIRQLLLYAFGVDDHEFIVSYETNSLEDFQNLIMDLRATKARLYTENDLPIFLCVHKSLPQLLNLI